jgi:hypothetical protein
MLVWMERKKQKKQENGLHRRLDLIEHWAALARALAPSLDL